MYVDNFFFTANSIKLFNEIKKLLANKYTIKNLKEVKTVMR